MVLSPPRRPIPKLGDYHAVVARPEVGALAFEAFPHIGFGVRWNALAVNNDSLAVQRLFDPRPAAFELAL